MDYSPHKLGYASPHHNYGYIYSIQYITKTHQKYMYIYVYIVIWTYNPLRTGTTPHISYIYISYIPPNKKSTHFSLSSGTILHGRQGTATEDQMLEPFGESHCPKWRRSVKGPDPTPSPFEIVRRSTRSTPQKRSKVVPGIYIYI